MAFFTIPLNDWANRIFAWCLSLTTLVLTCLAASSCQFLRITTLTGTDMDTGTYSVSLDGLFRFFHSRTGQCISYSLPLDAANPTNPGGLVLSGSRKAAKAFGVISPFLAGMAMFILLAPLLRTLSKGAWRSAAVLLAASAAFQALTFLIFNDDQCKTKEAFPEGGGSVQCSVDKGGNFAIAAIVVAVLVATVVCRTPPPEEEPLLSFRSDDGDKEGGGGTAAAASEAAGGEDAFANEGEAYSHPTGAPEGMAPYGSASSLPTGAPPQFRSATPPPSSHQQPPMGARRTVTETVNPDGSKTMYITTTMDGGLSQSVSSTASSSHAEYGQSTRHARGASGGGGDLGPVGEAEEV